MASFPTLDASTSAPGAGSWQDLSRASPAELDELQARQREVVRRKKAFADAVAEACLGPDGSNDGPRGASETTGTTIHVARLQSVVRAIIKLRRLHGSRSGGVAARAHVLTSLSQDLAAAKEAAEVARVRSLEAFAFRAPDGLARFSWSQLAEIYFRFEQMAAPQEQCRVYELCGNSKFQQLPAVANAYGNALYRSGRVAEATAHLRRIASANAGTIGSGLASYAWNCLGEHARGGEPTTAVNSCSLALGIYNRRVEKTGVCGGRREMMRLYSREFSL